MLILLVAAWLRFHALAQDVRFHPDEALFATFARSAAVKGEWLLPGALDKPPLTIYVSALSMALVGVTVLPDGTLTLTPRAGEFAARLPNVYASLLTVAVMVALAKGLYGSARRAVPLQDAFTNISQAGLPIMAAWLMALSPLAVAYSATAFTDGLLLLLLALSLWQMSARRPLWAGLWLALAFACKQQALLYLPLLLVGWGTRRQAVGEAVRLSPVTRVRTAVLVSLPVLAIFILLLVWDAARGQAVSLWSLAAANNDPGRLIRAEEVLPRLLAWAGHAQWLAGYGWMTAALTGLALAAIAGRVRREPRRWSTLMDVLLLAYGLAYGLLHWLVAFNTYDRYLLPVLPLVLLLIGRGLAWVLHRTGTRSAAVLLAVGILGLSPARDAAGRQVPIGGDHRDYAGMDRLVAHLNAKPLGTIIYDHWLGWELDYYLGAWTDKRRVYYPTPAVLAAGALEQPDPAPRYFAAPVTQPLTPWLDALRVAGFSLSVELEDGQFIVYRLIHPLAGAGV